MSRTAGRPRSPILHGYQLQSLWRMEEIAANTFDTPDAIGGKTLTDSDPTFSVVDGLLHNALRLGTAGLQTTPSNAFNFITNPFSVAFWCKRSAGTRTLTVNYGNAAVSYGAWITETDVQFKIDPEGADSGAADSFTVPSDTWTFICCRSDGTTVYLNVNDRAEQSSVASPIDQTGGTLTVLPAGVGTMDIDNLMISKAGVCWSDDQVRKLYAGGLGREVR